MLMPLQFEMHKNPMTKPENHFDETKTIKKAKTAKTNIESMTKNKLKKLLNELNKFVITMILK